MVQQVMRFTGPKSVDVVEVPSLPLQAGQVRVRTIASGVSAGTELTAYRGTNPYLTSTWDPELRLFRDAHPDSPSYPLEGWGYSEVGQVIESAAEPTDSHDVRVGDVVWGIWGHRSEGLLAADALRGHTLPPAMDPAAGCFVRVGAIALNAVVAANCGVGDTVTIFGQGVIGLLATAFASRGGARVIAVDGIERRLAAAAEFGANQVLTPDPEIAVRIRALTDGRGADMSIDLSGSYHALREAVRSVGPDSTVVAAGFYQGPATALALGEEFHHNRVTLVASQIGSIPTRLHPRWDRERLQQTVVGLLTDKQPDVTKLITHRFPLPDAARAYMILDEHPEEALQILLDCG